MLRASTTSATRSSSRTSPPSTATRTPDTRGTTMFTPLASPLRWVAAVMLLATAGTHVPLIREHLEEAPYVGVLFIALSVASVVLAILLVGWDTPLVWTASGAMTLLALAAFIASRTVGLPQIGDDIGNWSAPLGYPAVAVEALMTAAAAIVLSQRLHPAARKQTW